MALSWVSRVLCAVSGRSGSRGCGPPGLRTSDSGLSPSNPEPFTQTGFGHAADRPNNTCTIPQCPFLDPTAGRHCGPTEDQAPNCVRRVNRKGEPGVVFTLTDRQGCPSCPPANESQVIRALTNAPLPRIVRATPKISTEIARGRANSFTGTRPACFSRGSGHWGQS